MAEICIYFRLQSLHYISQPGTKHFSSVRFNRPVAFYFYALRGNFRNDLAFYLISSREGITNFNELARKQLICDKYCILHDIVYENVNLLNNSNSICKLLILALWYLVKKLF